jgi:hypothetical protein
LEEPNIVIAIAKPAGVRSAQEQRNSICVVDEVIVKIHKISTNKLFIE